ncbi:HK97-gp10 family putative phage morphogenesis protein [Streptomyces sp. NPDC003832]
MGFSGGLRGIKRALRRIGLLPAQANEARTDALREWATALEKTAKDLAPKRSGDLERSIEARANEGAGKAWVHIVPGKTREYAYYVEKGTSKMEAQPFLGPAAQIHRRTGERAMRRAVPRHMGR